MKNLSSNQIRQAFLDYFAKHQHQVVPSSSLVPPNDPTLLFTNAGMVQFKEVFLGLEKRAYTRATSAQRCVRAGGKHNDLENVGYTKRHHTFFEMLGNFSFGDYFKREAIQFAWQLLTEVFNVPPEKLWVTVYKEDKESEAIWLEELKVNPKRFSRCGEKDNFWAMGDTGPCGPCTEIFYDHGESLEGGPPGSRHQEGDRYVEVWNLVFMQYNRDHNGALQPLPQPCVDTGMGLERIAAVLQGVHDNYDIDIFQHLLRALALLVDCRDFNNQSMRVIVDHVRSVSFLIADGVTPSNEGRGYVLRRIMRRAIRHGYKLGQQQPFFYQLVPAFVEMMGEHYPELIELQPVIANCIYQEEKHFANTLTQGLKIFEHVVEHLTTDTIPGDTVFLLYDTYGFPPDLTEDIARERHLKIDQVRFEEAMSKQREQSQRSQKFNVSYIQELHVDGETEFTGYHNYVDEVAVTTLLSDHKPVTRLTAGESGMVVLDRTPFYAESGGQVGDRGILKFNQGLFRVENTLKYGRVFLHYGKCEAGELKVGTQIHAEVDPIRQATMANHSATHLLHEALRQVLGKHVIQKGSLVEPKRLRFDFSHPKPLSILEIQTIEQLINQQIRAHLSTKISEGTLSDAKAAGALALFDEKYGDTLRIVKMGEFSTEVCGGTHVENTSEIGLFKIISETACAAGIRRLEAVTGDEAVRWVSDNDVLLDELSQLLKVSRQELPEKIKQLLDQQRQLEKQMATLKQVAANRQSNQLVEQAIQVGGINVVAAKLTNANRDALRQSLDNLKQQLKTAAIVLASVEAGNVTLVTGVTKDCLQHFDAPTLLKQVADKIDGRGGGRPEMAQGGGKQPEHLEAALADIPKWVAAQLK